MTMTTSAPSSRCGWAPDRPRGAERLVQGGPLLGVQLEGRGRGGRACRLRTRRARDRDDQRRQAQQPGQGDLRRRRAVRRRELGERALAREAARTSRPAQRRVRHDGDARLLAALDHAAAQRAIVVRAERDLDGRHGQQLERLVQLRPADVREAGAAHEAVVDEPGQRAQARPPRRARIGRVQQVDVDRQAVQGGQARLAAGADRPRAAVGDPGRAGAGHPALGHDARPLRRPGARSARASSASLWPSSLSSRP